MSFFKASGISEKMQYANDVKKFSEIGMKKKTPSIGMSLLNDMGELSLSDKFKSNSNTFETVASLQDIKSNSTSNLVKVLYNTVLTEGIEGKIYLIQNSLKEFVLIKDSQRKFKIGWKLLLLSKLECSTI